MKILKTKKIQLEFNAYEMDLILKSLWLGYSQVDNEKLLFKNEASDKDKLFYLHRLLSSKANKFFYNKLNNDYYIFFNKKEKRQSMRLNNKKIFFKFKKRN